MARIAVDFDGVVIEDAGSSSLAPPRLRAGARAGLHSLKRAGHQLLLWSARASLARRIDPSLDPWVRAGKRKVDRARWEAAQPLHEARYQQMLAFIAEELPGVFDAIDTGAGGKPDVDLFLDDKAVRLGHGALGMGWAEVARIYGEPVYGRPLSAEVRHQAPANRR